MPLENVPAGLLRVFAFLLGACVGSFLNVCIYRMPAGESVVSPGSHCRTCGNSVRWFDNIPILSFFLLGGKCRYCGEKFSFRYLFVEVFTAALFAFSLPRILDVPCHPGLAAAFFFVFIAWLVAITFIDVDHFIIPDEFSLSGIVIGLAFGVACPGAAGAASRLEALGLGALGAFVPAVLLYLVGRAGTAVFKKDALGFGDVKFIAMIGAFLGLKLALLTLFFSAVGGTALSLVMIAAGRAGMKDEVPYGPYLALGAYISFMWGGQVLSWYMGLLGRG